jgi:hypothetical protein
MSNDQNTIETMTFEQAYRELDLTVQQLEAGNLPLEEALPCISAVWPWPNTATNSWTMPNCESRCWLPRGVGGF